jgi:hypothetical protein
MAADVEEPAQDAVQAVGDDDRLVEDRDRHEVARASQARSMGDQLPRPSEDLGPLALQHATVEVVAAC